MNDRVPRLVHAGDSGIRPWQRELVAEWLRANGIDPAHVCSDATITILPMPCAVAVPGEEPWQIHVIVFRQYFVGPDGKKELHFITRRPVTFERTVPLQVPFPAAPTPGSEGTSPHGQEPQVQPVQEGQRPPQHKDRAKEDEQQELRAAQAEEIQDRRQGARSERSRTGIGSRFAGAEEGCSTSRGGQVPEPEEDRRQEEVEVDQ